ncbi:MAG TPA: hypothetical protein VF230_13640 [Acidimicrobiales bacterium]
MSRVVDCAGAGEVVVNRAMADALAGSDTWALTPLGTRALKSFGDVELWALAGPVEVRNPGTARRPPVR